MSNKCKIAEVNACICLIKTTEKPEYLDMDADLLDIPVEIRRILLDFTLSCLQAGPVDYVEYGCKYFSILIQRRKDMVSGLPINPDLRESLKLEMRKLAGRRESVFAERYNPEEDTELVRVVIPKSDEERTRLAPVIKNVLLFRDLELEELHHIMDAMDQRFVKKDEIVILQGNVQADNFYVVNDGIFEASVSTDDGTKVVRTYENCGSFGELALMYNGPRAATVRAVTDGKLWVLDRTTFRRIVLTSSYRRRERYRSLIDNVDFLKTLTNYEKFDLADSFLSKTYSDGEEIFHQGDTADGMYFIESGAVKCTMDDPMMGQVKVQVLETGGYLGELALLTSMKRALSAYAVGNTKLAFLDKDTFKRLLGSCVEFLSRNFENYKNALRKIMGSKHISIDDTDIKL